MSKKTLTLANLTTYNEEVKKKYAEKAELPTKVSDLTNDTGFQTAADVETAIEGKADKATTAAGYGIADVYTKDELDGKISSVYKPGGSVAFSALPVADEAHLGFVYNVTDKFTATDAFVEGAGGKHPAGTNVVIVADGEGFKYDVLAGFVDLSDYAKSADFADVLRTSDFEDVTEDEIKAMFA